MKLGTDSRGNGLTWAIQILMSIGETVEADHLPEYLDEKAKQFVLLKCVVESRI